MDDNDASRNNDFSPFVRAFDKQAQWGRHLACPRVDRPWRVLGAAALLVAAGALLMSAAWRWAGGPPDGGGLSRTRIAMNVRTGDVIENFKVKDGDRLPWIDPAGGERVMYPVERCYWAAGGGVRAEPTYVVLREMLGEPGPTICPDCGRRVVRHNPLPPPELLLAAMERDGD